MIWKYGFTANEAIAFMRIVRPGSVVGPQQQYMYVKQLEWCKWAAVDEIRRQQNIEAADAAVPVAAPVTPATPPAEDDDEEERMVTTPPPTKATMPLPPVTPSRHVAAAAAKAKGIAPPGQPRKTPAKGKRVAPVDSDVEDGEEDDVLPQLIAPPQKVAKTATSTRPGAQRATTTNKTMSEMKPPRTTRSTAASRARAEPPASPTKASAASTSQRPNKIPRLAAPSKVGAAKKGPALKAAHNNADSDSSIGGLSSTTSTSTLRRIPQGPTPTPSRLPTLRSKTIAQTAALNEVAKSATRGTKAGSKTNSDAWMNTNAANAVVKTGVKSGSTRPGLRNVRRRRSSFSNADVVA
jgi:cell division cycle 14